MITLILISITAVVSFIAFQSPSLVDKLEFNAARIIHGNQYYRLISHAFIHAGWTHLLVNMMVLYFFGSAVESFFKTSFGLKSEFFFLLLYFGGIIASNLYALYQHKDNYHYNAIGASGAVSAVLFTFILYNPWEKLYFFGLFPIPGILFGVGYLIYSWYMGKRASDNVAHDAHFLGALFGLIFPVVLKPALFSHFLDQLLQVM